MSSAEQVNDCFSKLAPHYVVMNRVFSLGIDLWWRRYLCRKIAQLTPKHILDVASGTGDLALELQKFCPNSQVVATDFCQNMLDIAKKRGVVKTQLADALALPFDNESFDLVTVAFGLRNMVDYSKALNEMKRVLKPRGRLCVLDFSTPPRPISFFYFFYLNKIIPYLAKLTINSEETYQYLAKSIKQFPSGNEMVELIQRAGYKRVSCQPLSCGIVSIYFGNKDLFIYENESSAFRHI